jgi:hypothetical protein
VARNGLVAEQCFVESITHILLLIFARIARVLGRDLPPTIILEAPSIAKQAALMNNAVVLSDGTDSWTIPEATVHGWLGFTIINNRVRTAIDTKAVLARITEAAEKNAAMRALGAELVEHGVDFQAAREEAERRAAAGGLEMVILSP